MKARIDRIYKLGVETREAETEEEVNIEVNIEVNRDEIIESLREILRAARIQRLLNRAKDIRYIDEWIVKEENGSREGF